MSGSIAVGPVVVSLQALLVLLAWSIGWWVGARRLRADQRDVARLLTRTFVVALVAARVAWVVEWLDAYLARPLDLLDLRDGGWNLPVGLLLAWLYALAAWPRRTRVAGPVHLGLAVALLLYGAGTALLQVAAPADRSLVLRDLAVTTLDGAATTLGAFEGRPTVVNLWATWCGPCRREMPLLARAEAGRPDVAFVFVNQGEDAALVRRFLADEGLSLRHVVRDHASQVARAVDLRGWPTTLWLDAGGRVLAVDVGLLSSARLEQRLALLKGSASSR